MAEHRDPSACRACAANHRGESGPAVSYSGNTPKPVNAPTPCSELKRPEQHRHGKKGKKTGLFCSLFVCLYVYVDTFFTDASIMHAHPAARLPVTGRAEKEAETKSDNPELARESKDSFPFLSSRHMLLVVDVALGEGKERKQGGLRMLAIAGIRAA